jgi:dTMP kinase
MTSVVPAGRFITFEGIDGAGKSSQIRALQALVEQAGHPVILTREPGGTPLGEQLRELLLHQAMAADTELALMYAARAQHMHELVVPALQAGTWVLCDRFSDATFAYQGGGRGLPLAHIACLDDWMQGGIAQRFGGPVHPDRTYVFDLAPDVAAQRRAQARAADRFEQLEVAFFERVRAVYLDRARAIPQRYCILEAGLPLIEVKKLIEEDFIKYCL